MRLAVLQDRARGDRRGPRSALVELRAILVDLQAMADDLVLLRPVAWAELEAMLSGLRTHLAFEHPARFDLLLIEASRRAAPDRAFCERLLEEHRRYLDSSEQIAWFSEILARDDHGGNRQALGQYLRLLVESVHLHLADEAIVLATCDVPSMTPRGVRSGHVAPASQIAP